MARLSEYHKSTVRTTVDRLLDRRHAAVAFPFPSDDTSLVEMLYTTYDPDIVDAVSLLRNTTHTRRLLDYNNHTKIHVGGYSIRIRFDRQQVVFDSYYAGSHDLHKIPEGNKYYHDIAMWAEQMCTLHDRADKCQDLCRHILDHCKTPGQILRAWPQLAKYLPSKFHRELGEKQRASRLPDNLDMVQVNNLREDASAMLALTSMLVETGVPKIMVGRR